MPCCAEEWAHGRSAFLAPVEYRPFLVDAATVAEAIRKFDAKEVRTLDVDNACQRHGCH